MQDSGPGIVWLWCVSSISCGRNKGILAQSTLPFSNSDQESNNSHLTFWSENGNYRALSFLMVKKANRFDTDVNLVDHGKSWKVFAMKKNLLMIDVHASL